MKAPRVFGQALFENRPHLVSKGFLTPFIPAAEYAARRNRLLDSMRSNSLAIVPGNQVQFATPSVFYPFRQDPNFQYMTGFLEPSACLLLHKSQSGKTDEVLVVPEKDPKSEQWDGERTGTTLAKEVFGISDVVSTLKLKDLVKKLISGVDTVYADIDPKTTVRQGPFFNQELPSLIQSKTVKDVRTEIEALRLVKSESEIDCMRTAAEISAAAYNRAFKMQFESERQLHAFLDFMFKQGGCESDAYLAVVAGGSHALTIHYVRNDDVLRSGDLVLVDAGGRYGGYCADISRTWPVNGRFTPAQCDLYEAVLATNEACIAQCTVQSGMSMYDLHGFSERALQLELLNAGLDLSPQLLRVVYPHMIGHNLGLDVHDANSSGTAPFVANQVVTVEPGVYVPEDDRFPKHFQGLGIRVEDNVVVGTQVPEVLTEDCVKTVDDIEH